MCFASIRIKGVIRVPVPYGMPRPCHRPRSRLLRSCPSPILAAILSNLAEGLRLDIQATLVHASELFLIAPATVARYRGGAIPAEQAGREMGVRYVLQGAVRRSGRRMRVTTELTDVIARQIVWAERYDRVLEDGFDVQDDIVAEVLKGLDIKLASGEKMAPAQLAEEPRGARCFLPRAQSLLCGHQGRQCCGSRSIRDTGASSARLGGRAGLSVLHALGRRVPRMDGFRRSVLWPRRRARLLNDL
jgi:TolB-like protein